MGLQKSHSQVSGNTLRRHDVEQCFRKFMPVLGQNDLEMHAISLHPVCLNIPSFFDRVAY